MSLPHTEIFLRVAPTEVLVSYDTQTQLPSLALCGVPICDPTSQGTLEAFLLVSS